jgi:hypothetical protein
MQPDKIDTTPTMPILRYERSEREEKLRLRGRAIKDGSIQPRGRYTGEKLREIRAKNGVGRPINE